MNLLILGLVLGVCEVLKAFQCCKLVHARGAASELPARSCRGATGVLLPARACEVQVAHPTVAQRVGPSDERLHPFEEPLDGDDRQPVHAADVQHAVVAALVRIDACHDGASADVGQQESEATAGRGLALSIA